MTVKELKEKLMFKHLIYIISFLILVSCQNNDPYSEGSHWDYKIIYENGFVYKQKDRGIYQILNSDGTPLKVGKKIY